MPGLSGKLNVLNWNEVTGPPLTRELKPPIRKRSQDF